MKKILLPIFALILLAGFRNSKTRIITGLVVDSFEQPLQGVSIRSLPSGKKITTNSKGNFKIETGNGDHSIEFNCVGFEKQLLKLNKSNYYKVKLKDDTHKLSEIVVVGYGSTSKKEITGNTSMAAPMAEDRISELSTSAPAKSGAGTKLKSEELKDHSNQIKTKPNQLTAAEWNDIGNWDFWTDLMNNQNWSNKQQHWGYYLNEKVSVEVKNKLNQPLINYQVSLSSNNKVIWKSRSNYAGKAELFKSIFENNKQDFVLTVTSPTGTKVFEQAYARNIRKVNVNLNQNAEKIKNLDVMFMVDATGSMDDEIAYLKAELDDIIGKLGKEDKLAVRTGLVFYRDRGDDYVVRDFAFESDFAKVKYNLSKQYAGGGGDFEEAVDEAMENAIMQQNWTEKPNSAKIMFMILDAPPHHDSDKIKSIQKSTAAAAEKGIILIPVVASGIDKNTEFLMRFLAIGTNGTYVFITDDSGIGNSHLKPTIGKYKVEYLNDLLYRLTKKYAGLKVNDDEDLTNIAMTAREK